MQELSLDKFSPKKAEITALAEGFKGLTIKGVEDIEGYKTVYAAKQKLAKTRIEITKQGKAFREESREFCNNVISLEKELVGIVEPVEKQLAEQLDAIDFEKEKQKRVALLPERKKKLLDIGVLEIDDDFILNMDAT